MGRALFFAIVLLIVASFGLDSVLADERNEKISDQKSQVYKTIFGASIGASALFLLYKAFRWYQRSGRGRRLLGGGSGSSSDSP